MIIYLCIKFQSNTPSFQKISHGNQKCYTWDGQTGRTYIQTAVILYAPPPPPHPHLPIENNSGIRKIHRSNATLFYPQGNNWNNCGQIERSNNEWINGNRLLYYRCNKNCLVYISKCLNTPTIRDWLYNSEAKERIHFLNAHFWKKAKGILWMPQPIHLSVCLSHYLLLNHWAEFYQTCYITSPHGKGFHFLCLCMSMPRRPAICPSCFLLLNHWAEFNQTCYISSPHGKGVWDQHYFSVPPSFCASIHQSLTLSPPKPLSRFI